MASSSARGGRIAKRATSSTSPSLSNRATSSKGKAALQKLVDEAASSKPEPTRQPCPSDRDIEMSDCDSGIVEDCWQSRGSNNGQCPVLDGDSKPFNLMLLPAEIRNEIYRACLTRPYNILLSKREPPPAPEPKMTEEQEGGVASDTGDSDDETHDVDDHGSSAIRAFPPPSAFASSSISSQAIASGSQTQASLLRGWASRRGRRNRLLTSSTSSSYSAGGRIDTQIAAPTNATSGTAAARSVRTYRVHSTAAQKKAETPKKPRPQDADPLLVNILRCNKQIYQEARAILYSENLFTLDLDNALQTLAALHQRSRRQIKHVEVEIPSYNEILERFQETVRLSLRYCWGLKTFVIHMPFTLPGADGSGTTGNTTVYANGFDILRWLPKQCEVVLQGMVASEIEAVVAKNANLAKTLDEAKYAARQLILDGSPSRATAMDGFQTVPWFETVPRLSANGVHLRV